MANTPKDKPTELSAIPWKTGKPRVKKPRIPWQSASATPATEATPKPKHTKADTQHLGQQAETKALLLLQAQGLGLLARNYRCRCGELDLIMAQGNTAVVVEVRSRSSAQFGSALDSINHSKRQRINRCAALWWAHTGQRHFMHLRFDVVCLEGDAVPTWLPNAWQIHD